LTREEHENLQQVKHNKPLPHLDNVLNRMLPYEIRVFHVGAAPAPSEPTMLVGNAISSDEDSVEPLSSRHASTSNSTATTTRLFAWNAIHSSTRKLYSYRICVAPVMDPIYRFQRWQIPGDGRLMNITKLSKVLALYEGTHDFRAFAGAVEQAERTAQLKINSTRTIYQCNFVDESDLYDGQAGFYRIDIVLSGALYKMVRNMVGTAVDVSRGRVDEATLQGLIQASNGGQPQLTRIDNKSKPAPPEGLTLEWVYYDDDNDEF
jgi:tRNA pseudouridine(38-40) synthase